ncbi:hypothetical protein V8F20_012451 [Naviculisporaceae sp. PSN 640]
MAPAFVDLPAEIRLNIYSYLLTGNEATGIWFYLQDRIRYRGHPTVSAQGLHTAILRVNKKIHQECTHFLYTENRFFLSDDLIGSFFPGSNSFNRLGPHPALIRHLGFVYPYAMIQRVRYMRPDEPCVRNLWARFSESMTMIRRYCPNLTTIELLITPCWAWILTCRNLGPTGSAAAMDTLHQTLRKTINPREIIVTFKYRRLSQWGPRIMEKHKQWETTKWETTMTTMAAWRKLGWKTQLVEVGPDQDFRPLEQPAVWV